VLDSISLSRDSGCITVELMSRIEEAGFSIREVPVNHYPRPHGRSQFFNLGRVSATLWQLAGLWLQLRLGSDPAGVMVAGAPSERLA
jgi:hypothetical protein